MEDPPVNKICKYSNTMIASQITKYLEGGGFSSNIPSRNIFTTGEFPIVMSLSFIKIVDKTLMAILIDI